jgi:hypothetical protein
MFAKLQKSEVMVVDRSAIKAIKQKRLVYLLVASQARKYPGGKSAIMYIGSTEKGVARVASSAARQARWILGKHGVRKFTARVVTCPRRPGLKMWCVLERDLLLVFLMLFGKLPMRNKQRPKSLSGFFPAVMLERILRAV